ncbi:MAG: SoxR reducing system RseC family protein [Rhodospirillaceae bacterium]|nr:SoxR reducing system RseC family protein [Rhodospirillales bacterium]
MTQLGDSFPDAGDREVTEGIARVISVDGTMVWLEPEQTTACGGCASSKVCGAEPGSRRLVARRFSLVNHDDLRVGEHVVVGVSSSTLLRASMTAYGVPLLLMLVSGVTAQKLIGGDGAAAAATLAGLVVGLGLVRLWSMRFSARGELTPHFIRRVPAPGPDGACHGLDG